MCYQKGGPLAVTDANLFLGRLLPDYFPKIFGPTEAEPLNHRATAEAFERITKEVNAFDDGNKTPEQVEIFCHYG